MFQISSTNLIIFYVLSWKIFKNITIYGNSGHNCNQKKIISCNIRKIFNKTEFNFDLNLKSTEILKGCSQIGITLNSLALCRPKGNITTLSHNLGANMPFPIIKNRIHFEIKFIRYFEQIKWFFGNEIVLNFTNENHFSSSISKEETDVLLFLGTN